MLRNTAAAFLATVIFAFGFVGGMDPVRRNPRGSVHTNPRDTPDDGSITSPLSTMFAGASEGGTAGLMVFWVADIVLSVCLIIDITLIISDFHVQAVFLGLRKWNRELFLCMILCTVV